MKRNRKKTQANALSISEPNMVTLTKSPANRSGFKIMRSDAPDAQTEELVSRADYMMSVTLPDGITEDEAKELAEDYGLTDGYTMKLTKDRYVVYRDDAEEDVETVEIPISNGLVAHVDVAAFHRSDALDETKKQTSEKTEVEKHNLQLVAIRFDNAVYATPFMVDEWLEKNDIPYPAGGVVQHDTGYVVQRDDVTEDAKEIVLAEGITGVIRMSELDDLPYILRNYILDAAWGQHGWGHIDFLQAMADVEFCDRSHRALEMMQSVLHNIIFYSDLPVEMRKVLILETSRSYAAYMSSLIDSLPMSVVERVLSDDQPEKQEITMPKKDEAAASGTDVKRTAEEIAADAAAADKAKAEGGEFVTRSELTAAIAEGVTAALAASGVTKVERSDADTAAAAAAEAGGEKNPVLEAINALSAKVDGISEEQKALRSDFEEAEGGTTITRSAEEAAGVKKGEEEKTLTRNDPGFWAGSIGRKAATN